jgi:hypothetical protein
VRGRKKWIMLPPDFTPPGIYPCDDGSEVTVPLSVMEWFMNHYEEAAEGAGTSSANHLPAIIAALLMTFFQRAARLWRPFAKQGR